MTRALHLTIATPVSTLVDDKNVSSLRAEDESGSFGVLPGHVDLLTALPPSVVRWSGPDGALHFCALRGGLMTIQGGTRVEIGCREGILGDDIHSLEAEVIALRESQLDIDRRSRVEELRLHAIAIRQIIETLRQRRPGEGRHPPGRAAGVRGARR